MCEASKLVICDGPGGRAPTAVLVARIILHDLPKQDRSEIGQRFSGIEASVLPSLRMGTIWQLARRRGILHGRARWSLGWGVAPRAPG